MGRIEAFAFDLDGTLLDTVPWFVDIYKETLRYVAGIEISTKDLLAALGPPEPEVFRFLAPAYQERCVEHFRISSLSTVDEISIIDGVREVLENLSSRGVALAVVTSRGESLARELITRFDLSKYFRQFYFGEGSQANKVRDLKHFSVSNNLDRAKCAYVGDFESDCFAASEAGFLPVAAFWGTQVVSTDWASDALLKFSDAKSFLLWIIENQSR